MATPTVAQEILCLPLLSASTLSITARCICCITAVKAQPLTRRCCRLNRFPPLFAAQCLHIVMRHPLTAKVFRRFQ